MQYVTNTLRHGWRSFLALGLALGLAACSTLDQAADSAYSLVRSSAPHGETSIEIERDGAVRSAIVSLPPGFGKRPVYPAVIDLHGEDANALVEMRASGMGVAAGERGFVAVFPNAVSGENAPEIPLESRRLTWRADGKGAAEDLSFLGELIDTLIRSYRVDPKRIYVVGFSNGATMAYRLGCELSHKLAGLGAVDGAMEQTGCRPVKPLPLIVFHASSDAVTPYAGGPKSGAIARTVAFWTRSNGCDPAAESTRKGNVIRESYQDGQGLGPVTVYTLLAAEHGWPGVKPPGATAAMAPSDLHAAWIMLDFFAKQGGH